MRKRGMAADTTICKTVSAMEKIVPGREPMAFVERGTALKNEWYHFQVAIRCDFPACGIFGAQVKAIGGLADYMRVSIAENVPCNMTSSLADDDYVEKAPTLLPDPLKEFGPDGGVGMSLPFGQWKGAWVSLKVDDTVKAGVYETKFEVVDRAGEFLAECSYTIEVIDAVLPETDLRITNWMHYDCIAWRHNVELFSKEFYEVFASYLDLYVEGGYNMLLTPIFTPPLDTAVGGERMTAQLVRVKKTGGEYEFDFSKLKEFLSFVFARGVKYVEFSHLFTQWGGEFCPKIMAEVDGEEKRIFGWDVSSDSEEYTSFLEQFFKALGAFIQAEGIKDRCYFHLTDEPHGEQIVFYEKCRNAVKKHIGDMPIMDAMGEYSFYERGLVDIPVVSIGAYHKYAEHDAKDIYVYNCCGPVNGGFSNRFINMPSERTRVMGYQIYQSGVLGYLHWGYNFYNTVLSLGRIDPYADTSAGGAFPPGDGFIVYPTEKGAIPSVRWAAAQAGFQDYRAMKLLESYIGREKALKLLEEWGLDGYQVYPHGAEAHESFRNKINLLIKEYAAKA